VEIHRSSVPTLVLDESESLGATESHLLVGCRVQNGKDKIGCCQVSDPTSMNPSGESIRAKMV
jgi:hypothetical protein